MKYKRCVRCHRKLKTPTSMATGLGSTCYKKTHGKAEKNVHMKKTGNVINHETDGQLSIYDVIEKESEV